MSEELKFENLGEGIYKRADGKFFYADETGEFIGPFDSEESARQMLDDYEESLKEEENWEDEEEEDEDIEDERWDELEEE